MSFDSYDWWARARLCRHRAGAAGAAFLGTTVGLGVVGHVPLPDWVAAVLSVVLFLGNVVALVQTAVFTILWIKASSSARRESRNEGSLGRQS